MNQRRWLVLLYILVLMILLLGACGGASGGGTSVWIDVPVDGLWFPSLQEIQIEGHAASPGGISRVEIWVNGAVFTTINNPPAEGTLAKFQTAWTPAALGEYTIQAVAFGADGSASQPDSTRLIFGGDPLTAPVGCPSPIGGGPTPLSCGPVGCPSPVGGGPTPLSCEPVGCPSPVGGGPTPLSCGPVGCPSPVGGGPTPVSCEPRGCPSPVGGGPTPVDCSAPVPVTDTPTSLPPGGAVIQFWADPSQIEAGKCTTMRWHAENVQKVIFGGVEQPFEGSYKDCLCESERYTLTVVKRDGTEEKHRVDITVNGSCSAPEPEQPAQQDTTPPSIPSLIVPGDGLSVECKAEQTLAWLPVDDPSGIAKYGVQVQMHAGDNNWQAAPRGDQSVTGKSTTIPVECGLYYRWRVIAVDGAGNESGWSGWFTFAVPLT